MRRRQYYEQHRDQEIEAARQFRIKNPEKIRQYNQGRMFAGGIYLGRCGFTKPEVEAMLSGTSN